MSLILKGIDLPTDENKPLIVEIWASGTVWEEIKGDYMCLRNSAIQIPKGHGRLIDENLTYIDKTIDGYFEIYAPTILEAEEADENQV